MTRRRRAFAWLIVLLLWLVSRPVAAQSISLSVSGLKADSMPPAPNFSLAAVQNRPDLGPYTVTLELSLEPDFTRPFYVNAAAGEVATFRIDSLLPEKTTIYLRARLTDAGSVVRADTRQQHVVQAWVRLIEPAQQRLVNLTTRRPRFIWSSPGITLPPGPWEYDLTVINTATGQPAVLALSRSDTVFVVDSALEANTSYSWQVRARGENSRGQAEVVVRSAGTFVISEAVATIFYQNFPNPFGRGQLQSTTCLWFDLARPSRVRLTIYDLSLRRVRRMIPGAVPDVSFPTGSYGRGDIDTQTGCDTRFVWDGRDDNGRFVPPGVYIAEFQGDGLRATIKMMFKGPP
jgi:hypothetical protein